MTRTVFLLAVLFSTFTAFAQQPSFFIERIDVRGTRFTSDAVVRRQTLLREGETYSEAQIKAAIDRVNRLPFVIDAEPSLEKGSEREHYVLAIRITETKPLFIDAQSVHAKASGSPIGWTEQNSIESGVRGFLGSTLLHASTDFKGVYSAGVTQYDLFGSPAFASLNVRWTDRRHFGAFADPISGEVHQFSSKAEPSTELLLGIPVRGNHSIHVSWSHSSFEQSITTGGDTVEEKVRNDFGTAAWIYDSTDDALFPTRGNFARAGFYLTEGSSRRVPEDPSVLSFGLHRQTAFVEARHYWDFGSIGSVSAGATAARTRTPFPRTIANQSPQYDNSYGAVAGYSVSLWPQRETRRFGDLRLELDGQVTKFDSAVVSPEYYTFIGGIAFRNPWALLHLTFQYNRQGNL